MKRIYPYLALSVAITVALALITIDTIHDVRHMGDNGVSGWLIFSPVGTLTGAIPLMWLLGLLTIDGLWVLALVIWAIKHLTHSKGDDNTLYLP
jgi:hypothetical protein